MFPWFVRRVATSLLLVFLVTSAVFFLVRLMPGDPVHLIVDESLVETDRDLIRVRLGLDRPLGEQYLAWLGGLARGDLGTSLVRHRPVAEMVGEAIGPTLLLTGTAYLIHLVLAFLVGVGQAARRGRLQDHVLQVTGLLLYSVPVFWLGLLLRQLLATELGWFPTVSLPEIGADRMPLPARTLGTLHDLALPALTLGLWSFMGTARFLRARLDEVLASDHIAAARARGVPERSLLWRHALREALLPVITLAGLHLPFLVGGAVVVEHVFGWHGVGSITVAAAQEGDFPVTAATTLLSACAVVLGSLLADLAYRWADPRLRRPGEGAA